MASIGAILEVLSLIISLIGIIPCFLFSLIYQNMIIGIIYILINIFFSFRFRFNKFFALIYILTSYLSYYFYTSGPGVDGNFSGLEETTNGILIGSLLGIISIVTFIILFAKYTTNNLNKN